MRNNLTALLEGVTVWCDRTSSEDGPLIKIDSAGSGASTSFTGWGSRHQSLHMWTPAMATVHLDDESPSGSDDLAGKFGMEIMMRFWWPENVW